MPEAETIGKTIAKLFSETGSGVDSVALKFRQQYMEVKIMVSGANILDSFLNSAMTVWVTLWVTLYKSLNFLWLLDVRVIIYSYM